MKENKDLPRYAWCSDTNAMGYACKQQSYHLSSQFAVISSVTKEITYQNPYLVNTTDYYNLE